MNATFQPPYKGFLQRTFGAFASLILASIAYWGIAVKQSQYFTIMLFIYIPLLALFVFITIKKNSKYLKRVTVIGDKFIIEVTMFDKAYKTVELDIQKVNIKIYDSLSSAGPGRKFDLIIDTKNERGVYYTVYKQPEKGGWTLELFKEIYISYCEVTGKTPHTSSLTSFGLSEKKRRV